MRNSKLSDEAKREFKLNFAYVFSAMAFAAAVLSYFSRFTCAIDL